MSKHHNLTSCQQIPELIRVNLPTHFISTKSHTFCLTHKNLIE